MNTYGLYARKSDEDKTNKVRSIPDQKKELAAIIERDELVVPVFLEDERSARLAANRPEFDKLINLIRQGTINAILVWAVHRLARNMTEGGMLQDLLTSGQIQEIRTPQQIFRPGDNILPFVLEIAWPAPQE